ncbi:uncharacterized protein LOC124328287 isoform X2 [Daphnia pulicaria]|uniref:uncharacterized protein LOC124328287 isoform X2 n=1 Tax=Daphnia pulicaria TaxID=35523 RepID=UPI001EECCFAF|nr:uncharacterized protein LOC124328287 isoform X2 [Daphnia pulicaria]
MSSLNHSGEESSECPLCMEPLEMDDLSFYPCTCGYQICRFCWHRIRTDENGLCPACRKAYPENPADFKPLSTQEMHRIKAEKRQKDQQKKQKATENRKHLANVRVVQRNLVFVVGLSPRLADPEVLKRHEYFGKLGKIHKVVINHSTQYAGSQGPSASAYVTYIRGEDALRAIQSVNNITVDGRTLRASLGTTKYCSHFMKNQVCPKPDCMYLHEIGDDAASFTKEEMQQGKHTDYERLLHEQLLSPCLNHKEGRKASASPPLKEGASNATQSGPKDGWPSLPPGCSTANPSSLNTSGKVVVPIVKSEPPLTKEKSGKIKAKPAQPSSVHIPVAAVQPEESSLPQAKTNGSNRKAKEKTAVTAVLTAVLNPTAPVTTQPTKPERQRSTSLSPALSTSSNPTPPLVSSSSSPSSSQDSGFLPSNQHEFEILKQGASMAAEEEEIDRARDEAEDYFDPAGNKVTVNSSSFAHSILDTNNSSNSHSFFSTGPLPAYTAQSNGTSPSGCWLANGAEEESITSTLPNQSAADWQLAFNDLASSSRLVPNVTAMEDPSNHQSKNTDDDLGFDPFHETQKALAEMLEKESISSLPNGSVFSNGCSNLGYSGPVQSLYSNPPVPPSMTRHSPSFSSLGLGLGLGVGVAPQPQPSRTRIPPPGFNPTQHLAGSMNQGGVSHFGLSLPNLSSNRPVNRLDMGTSKMLPFMNNQSTANGGVGGPSTGYGPRLYHDSPSLGLGMSGIGGMSGGGMSSNMSYMGGQNGSLSHLSNNKPQGYNTGMGSNMPYSNGSNSLGLGTSGIGDPAPSMKDWQDGLRALFPNVNISMGNGGVTSSNGSSNNSSSHSGRMGAFPPGLSGLGNGQPQQMHHQHHQHQMTQQPNSLAAKGWRNGSDWTSLDPAIVSSGQITDSRSDSPPHWLRSLEQLTETGNSPAQQPPSNPSNLFGLANSTHYNLPSLSGRSNVTPASGLDGLNSMGSFWPSVSHTTPSMPPPGFSHIRPTPKTASTAETHKIDNL